MKWNTVVSMPAIHCGHDFIGRYGGDYGPWRLGVVSLSWSMFVYCSIINHSSWRTIRFGSNHHPAAPGDWIIDWNSLQHTKPDISVKSFLDSIFPVEWDLAGTMDCNWFGIIINKYPQWWTIFHESEWLVLTTVEGRSAVPVKYVLFQYWNILRCWSTGQDGWCGGWSLPSGTGAS